MASRVFQYFMTTDECEQSICAIARELHLWMALENFLSDGAVLVSLAPHNLRFPNGALAERIRISNEQPSMSTLGETGHFDTAQLGWVTLRPAHVEQGVLLMADLGAKSNWMDLRTGREHERPDTIALFNKIVYRLRKQLPYFARNRWKGEEHWHETKIRHSVGIAEWVRKGGAIGQWGAPNVEYASDAKAADARSE